MSKRILIKGVGFALITLAIAAAGSLAMSTSANYNPRPSYAAPPTPQADVGSVVTSQSVQHVSAPSTGSSFMSSIGGAFAGSMLGNMISSSHGSGGTTVLNNGSPGGAAAPAVMASGMSAPGGSTVIVQEPASASPWSMVLSLMGWCVLLGVAALTYLAWRMVKQAQSYSSVLRNTGANMPDTSKAIRGEINFSLVKRFQEINQALASGDQTVINSLVPEDLRDTMLALQKYEGGSKPFEAIVAYEVLDLDEQAGVLSVYYTGRDLTDKVDIGEVWHYTRQGDAWSLAGVENINA